MEDGVFQEIRHCTYRSVLGFHKKYFEDKRWSRRAKRIWRAAKSHYSDHDQRWTQLPDAPTENDVCAWWLGLQQELLASERAAYFRSPQGDQVGAETERQLGLLVKRKRDGASDAKHDLKHVSVVGELRTRKDEAVLLQIGSAVRNLFANQPLRLFVPAFTLAGTTMESWVFDRSGPYSGATFDIHEEPEKFIQVMCGYLMMSDQELGLDTVTTGKNDRLFVTIPVEVRGKMRNRELELDPDPIAFQRAIVCRGTSCFLAKPKSPSRHDWVAKLPWTSSMRPAGYNWVVKFSWTSGMRPAEADLLRKANNRGVKGLAKMVGYHEVVTSISKLRQGLVFPNPHKFRRAQMSSQSHFSPSEFGGLGMTNSRLAKRKSTDGGSLVSKRCRLSGQSAQAEHGPYSAQEPENSVQEPESTSLIQYRPYENRIFRVLAVSPAGRSISQFRSIVELLEGLRDAIKAHRSLFMDGRILHRDISENNIIITDPDIADGFKGMLIDLDLAKEDGMPGGGARHRTGTMEFRPSRSYGQYPSSIPYA